MKEQNTDGQLEQTQSQIPMTYLGVKKIMAVPMHRSEFAETHGSAIEGGIEDEEGYLVIYSSTYQSWSPKEVFEKAYFPMLESDGSKITQEMVDVFLGSTMASQFGDKTTLVHAKTLTGFEQIEVSSCVDPKNFDMSKGAKYATDKIKSTLWMCMGFVLQWAEDGLFQDENDDGANAATDSEDS